jgi:hypothetical protein
MIILSRWRFGSGLKQVAIQPLDIGGGGDLEIVDSGGGGDSTPINIDSGDVSGGTTSNATAQAVGQIEEFASEGGGVLAIVYGEHLIAGHLILHKFIAGTPNTSIIYVALGDGRGNGGEHGEWENVVAVYYAGAAQSVSPNGSTAGYRFYNGFISTAVASGLQQVDAFLTGNLAYSGTAYIAVKLTDAVANAEDRPDKLRGRYKGRRTFDYNIIGNFAGYDYSVNPARVAIDRLQAYYEHKFPNDNATALRKLQEKVDWESWYTWRNFNLTQIQWFTGTSTISIQRFEAHIAFTQDTILADALDQICATAGAFWQDDGEKIIFLPPDDARLSSHHFDESNIIAGSLRIQPQDLRDSPNHFTAEFRDFDDPFLGLASTPPIRREKLISQVGEIKTVRAFANMRQSQAQRLLERQARLEVDNPIICSLIGDETSINLLPGDFVTVSHSIPGWTYQRCLVLSVNLIASEDGTDTCEFTLQKIDGPLYDDTAHGPRQEALTP